MTETQSQVSTHSEPSPEPMVSNPEATVSDSQPLGEAVMLTDTQTSESVVGGSVTPITVATNLQGNLQQLRTWSPPSPGARCACRGLIGIAHAWQLERFGG